VTALDRLVSVKDYADYTRTFAGIGKANAIRLSDGRMQLVHLTIAGVGDIPIDPSSDLYRNLLLSLQMFGDPFLPVQVCLRRVKLLVISAGIRLEPDYLWESVEPKIRAALLAGFDVEARDLGQPAFLSEAIAMMQAIEGVQSVDPQTFDSVAEDITAEELLQLATTLTRRRYVVAELARLDPTVDASAERCARIKPADLVYLTPAIPGTLILTEIGA
jgi:hypothetical protein